MGCRVVRSCGIYSEVERRLVVLIENNTQSAHVRELHADRYESVYVFTIRRVWQQYGAENGARTMINVSCTCVAWQLNCVKEQTGTANEHKRNWA